MLMVTRSADAFLLIPGVLTKPADPEAGECFFPRGWFRGIWKSLFTHTIRLTAGDGQ